MRVTRKLIRRQIAIACACMLVVLGCVPFGGGVIRPAVAQTKNIQELFASAARGSTTGLAYDLGADNDFNLLRGYLDVTAQNGTSLDVKLQESVDNSVWSDIPGGAFAQVTTAQVPINLAITCTASPSRWVRAKATVVGTTFTFSTRIMAYKTSAPVSTVAALDASLFASGTLPTARLSQDVARTVSVTVPTASVLTLNGTPFTLIAAQGAGTIVLIEEITCKLVFNSVAYTGSNAVEFRYTNGSGAKVIADMSSAFLNSASGTNYRTVKSVVTELTPVANALVCVFVPTANPGAGNSDLVFTIKYRIVTP